MTSSQLQSVRETEAGIRASMKKTHADAIELCARFVELNTDPTYTPAALEHEFRQRNLPIYITAMALLPDGPEVAAGLTCQLHDQTMLYYTNYVVCSVGQALFLRQEKAKGIQSCVRAGKLSAAQSKLAEEAPDELNMELLNVAGTLTTKSTASVKNAVLDLQSHGVPVTSLKSINDTAAAAKE